MFKQFIKQTPFGVSLLLMVLAAAIVALILPINGAKSLIVRSGSMEPAIKTGDLVIVRPAENYKAGDIIAFKDPAKQSITVTHRIAGIKPQNGNVFYQTRGDANEEADFSLVPQTNVIGKARYSIKGIGKLFAFSKTKEGFLSLAIIPAAFVILLEAVNIIKEVRKTKTKTPRAVYRLTVKHLYHHYGKPMGVAHPSASFKGLLAVVSHKAKGTNHKLRHHIILRQNSVGFRAVLPILASLLLVGNTFSFFSDTETSTGNLFQAAESFCNSQEGHVVINEVFYNVDTAHNGKGSENNWEWVELFNPTSTVKDITGWKIADSNQTDNLPAGTITIEPCSFAIVSPVSQSEFTDQSNDGGRWTIPAGVVFINLGSFIGNGLPAGGDAVILKNNLNNEIDAMSYGTDTSKLNPAVPAVSSGHSSERDPDGVDTNTASDFVDRNPPTPGT